MGTAALGCPDRPGRRISKRGLWGEAARPSNNEAIMKCEWVQQNVLLYVYDELPDDARHELEQHVVRCKDCAAELDP